MLAIVLYGLVSIGFLIGIYLMFTKRIDQGSLIIIYSFIATVISSGICN